MSATLDGVSRYAGAGVLAVGAHPDDLESAAGGTLARLVQAGARVVMAVLSTPVHGEVRSKEARAAAGLLGCELRLITTDGRRVEDLKTYEAVAALDGIVRELKPKLIIAHSLCDYHRDHTLAAEAALATQRLGHFDYWRFSTGLRSPHPRPFEPSLYVDVSSTLDLKIKALGAHASQFGERHRDLGIYREVAAMRGREAGVPFAEAFEVGRLILN